MIYLLSGPPRSGKDTLATQLLAAAAAERLSAAQFSVAEALKRATHGFYAGLGNSTFVPPAGAFESTKDEPSDFLLGLTPREAYVRMHEEFIKPQFGPTYLALRLRDLIDRACVRVAVVADVGNDDEAQALRPDVVIHVHRPEVQWIDNRSPITTAVKAEHIHYNSVPDEREVLLWARRFLRQ